MLFWGRLVGMCWACILVWPRSLIVGPSWVQLFRMARLELLVGGRVESLRGL